MLAYNVFWAVDKCLFLNSLLTEHISIKENRWSFTFLCCVGSRCNQVRSELEIIQTFTFEPSQGHKMSGSYFVEKNDVCLLFFFLHFFSSFPVLMHLCVADAFSFSLLVETKSRPKRRSFPFTCGNTYTMARFQQSKTRAWLEC